MAPRQDKMAPGQDNMVPGQDSVVLSSGISSGDTMPLFPSCSTSSVSTKSPSRGRLELVSVSPRDGLSDLFASQLWRPGDSSAPLLVTQMHMCCVSLQVG